MGVHMKPNDNRGGHARPFDPTAPEYDPSEGDFEASDRRSHADRTASKTELVASIAAATGQSQAAVSGILDALFATISDAVAKGATVSIPGWISFELVATSARTGRNPQTGAEIKIPAGKRVKVTAGSKLRAAALGK